jgi:DNA-binding CsgD family transcriptional regulator
MDRTATHAIHMEIAHLLSCNPGTVYNHTLFN